MNAIRAIIADDEAPLREYLRVLLQKIWPELVICAEAENGLQAMEMIEKEKPDIAFLDIKMPGFSGIEVAEKMTVPCRVVFITAFDAYAVEAFDKAAVDYILKPATEERLRVTVERLQIQIAETSGTQAGITSEVRRILSEINTGYSPRYIEWVNARRGEEIRIVRVADICYFKAEDKYTVIRTREGEHLIRTSIRKLEESLDPANYWRIHRGTIINVGLVNTVHRSLSGRLDITLVGLSEKLTVSRTYAYRFKQM
jgi:DNA-binding LytR/AlgR family response regulator